MNRRTILGALLSFPLLFSTRLSAAQPPAHVCADCGSTDVLYYDVGPLGQPEVVCTTCYRARSDAEYASRKCRHCGMGTEEWLGGWYFSGDYCCEPCHAAETKLIFERASCQVCGTKPVVTFYDGTPLCTAHSKRPIARHIPRETP